MKSRRDNKTAREIAGALQTARIAVVDDDQSVREAIKSLLRSVGMIVDLFASAEEFLKAVSPKDVTCLILDVQMTGMSGLELQERLISANHEIPMIFITAHASDTEARTRAMEAGAVDFLHKPFNDEALLKNVYGVLQSSGGAV